MSKDLNNVLAPLNARQFKDEEKQDTIKHATCTITSVCNYSKLSNLAKLKPWRPHSKIPEESKDQKASKDPTTERMEIMEEKTEKNLVLRKKSLYELI